VDVHRNPADGEVGTVADADVAQLEDHSSVRLLSVGGPLGDCDLHPGAWLGV